jgi:hypothetical protein
MLTILAAFQTQLEMFAQQGNSSSSLESVSCLSQGIY